MNSTCMVQGEECFLPSKLLEQDTDNNFKFFSLRGLIAPGNSMRVEGGVSDNKHFSTGELGKQLLNGWTEYFPGPIPQAGCFLY